MPQLVGKCDKWVPQLSTWKKEKEVKLLKARVVEGYKGGRAREASQIASMKGGRHKVAKAVREGKVAIGKAQRVA